MKNKTLILTLGPLLFALSATAQIAFTVAFSGSPDENDRKAAVLIIEQENERRAALETPLPALPYATGPDLKASYLQVLSDLLAKAHNDFAEQAKRRELENNVKELWQNATDAQRAAAVAALQE